MPNNQRTFKVFRIAEKLKQLAAKFRGYGEGTSNAALLRKDRRDRATFHTTHTPGEIIKMSGGKCYQVAKDGSYRRIVAA